ncbi:MAG: type II toxin-antitoxin system RelE/ParE family toxin [Pseudomonadota bacterium]
MKERAVKISDDAEADLVHIYRHVAQQAGPDIAFSYIERIQKHLESYNFASKRGSVRDDIRPNPLWCLESVNSQ